MIHDVLKRFQNVFEVQETLISAVLWLTKIKKNKNKNKKKVVFY